MKIGIVGAGTVGTACLYPILTRGCASEIVVDRTRAKGVVTDLKYGGLLAPFCLLRDGEVEDLAGAAAVLITAGVNEKTGGATDRADPAGRLRLLATNAAIYRDIVPRVHRVITFLAIANARNAGRGAHRATARMSSDSLLGSGPQTLPAPGAGSRRGAERRG